ncbi:MAG: Na+/H+ antiporter, partial [Gammaproteobacteria bacterium]
LKGLELPEEPNHEQEEDLARTASARAALEAVERLRRKYADDEALAERYNAAATQVSALYQRKLGASEDAAERDPVEARAYEQAVRELRGAGLKAERNELFKLARERRISDELSRRLVRNLDLIEARQRS